MDLFWAKAHGKSWILACQQQGVCLALNQTPGVYNGKVECLANDYAAHQPQDHYLDDWRIGGYATLGSFRENHYVFAGTVADSRRSYFGPAWA